MSNYFIKKVELLIELLTISLIVILAVAIRVIYFIGYGLGDDLSYVNLSKQILAGHWVNYAYLNQYAYRPLLLLSVAGSFKLFGINEIAFILPIFLFSICSIPLAYYLGKRLFNSLAGILAALTLAIYPFNVFNSVTFDNDVIIAFFMGLVVLLFIKARESEISKQTMWYSLAGFFLVISYLFKMTSLTLIALFIPFTLFDFVVQRRNFRQVWFYISFGVFFFMVLCFYKVATGEFFRHFIAERVYYNTYIPDYYLKGAFSVKDMLLQYPLHMFQPLIFGEIKFFEFGLYLYFFIPALLLMFYKNPNQRYNLLLLWWFVSLFASLEFSPSNWDPYFLPVPRQERYLEIINLPIVLTIGWFLAWIIQRKKIVGVLLFSILAITSLYNTHTRNLFVRESIASLKEVSNWLCNNNAREVYVDVTGLSNIIFFTQACNINVRKLDEIGKGKLEKGVYVISGGSRMHFWDPHLIQTIKEDSFGLKFTKILEYKESRTPTRKGPLKLYRYDGELAEPSNKSSLWEWLF
jgi:4-amino-4-deoxy-L-arabinose transferase-like glycosyltransferase